jgi:hypothetical protein
MQVNSEKICDFFRNRINKNSHNIDFLITFFSYHFKIVTKISQTDTIMKKTHQSLYNI